jgi:PAS domain S-box-containing protein
MDVREHIELTIVLSQSDPLNWIFGMMIFLLMGILFIYALTIVVQGLEENSVRTTLLAEEVEQSNKTLRMSEARYRTLVETCPDMVVQLDVNWNVLLANRAGLDLFGYESQEEVIGKNFMDFIAPDYQLRMVESFQKTQAVGGPKEFESLVLKKNNVPFFAEFNAAIVRDEAGRHQYLIGVGRDISLRKEQERLLREAKDALAEKVVETTTQLEQTSNRLDELVKHGPAVLYSQQAYGDRAVTYFSENAAAILGYEPKNFIEDKYFWSNHVHPDDKERVLAQASLAGMRERFVTDYRFLHKDGAYRWIRDERVLHRDELGNAMEYVGSWSDITDRKQMEQSLRESEQRYRELLDHSMQGVIVFRDLHVIYANQTVLDALGFTESELKSLPTIEILRHIHPDDQRIFWERLHKALEEPPTRERYSIRVSNKNGEYLWLDVRITPVVMQGEPAVMLTGINVTEIRKVQAELQENARTQQTILNAIDALVFLVDTNTVLISTNDKFARRMGMSAENMVGTAISSLFSEEERRERTAHFENVISSGKPITFQDSRGGTWFENSYYPIVGASGKVVKVVVFARDITVERQMAEALRASEKRYRILAEASHDVIFTINPDESLDFVNSFGANVLGLTSQQMHGQPWWRFFPPEIRQQQTKNILRVLKTGEAISTEVDIKLPSRTFWFHSWLIPLKDASGKVTSVLGVLRDITGRKKDEIALQQARDQLEQRVAERTSELSTSQEKLRLLTAQTIAAQEEERRSVSRELHDEAGQALIAIKFDLATIQNELPKKDALRRQRLSELMKIIDQTMLHIRALAHSLRPPVLEVGGIDLSLQDYCQELAERTKIQVYYKGREIPGIPDEIGISLYRFVQEAMTNILKHAQASQVKVQLMYKKKEISISVSDDGRGIDDTAPPGGLGLLGIRERLDLLGGRLEIHSRKGRGTKLVAYVPWAPSSG